MANINLRLYGDQIYPNISKYLTKYISPDIQKEEFLSMYKSGRMELKELSLKENISLNSQIKIEEASISEMNINIPDEKENFGMSINNIKCLLTISEISENEIEKLLIEDKKNLIDEFINYSVKKIQKKDGPSFLDNLIKSVVEKILNGLTIEIKNLELKIKAKNRDNIYFIFLIDNLNYSFDKGAEIKNINLLYEEQMNKINIIEKFNINLDVKSSAEKEKPNQINMTITDYSLKLNKKIYEEFANIYDLFDEAKYKKIYTKYKKLILFHKPKTKEDGKKDYKLLWEFSIKTIINLRKYVGYKKCDIFDLTNFAQIKIIEKYLENNENLENILLTEDNNILKATKKKVEKKILDDKNSNVLANAFNFFFGAKKEEKKNELTEEEKEIMEEIYKNENIIKYLNNDIEKASSNFNIISEKIKSFFSNFTFNFEFTKLQLNIENTNKFYNVNFVINGLKFNYNYIEKQFDLKFIINDIGYKTDKSFFNKKNKEDNAIEITRDKNSNIDLKLGFDNIEIKIDEFIGIFIFLNSIKKKKNIKIFYEKINTYKENKHKDIQNQIINDISNFSFIDNFKLTNFPSLSLLTKNNKIDLKIFNYSLSENSINFTINLNDSFGKILNDLTFNLQKKDKKFNSIFETPIEIILQKETLSTIISNYSEYSKEISKENKQKNNNENIYEKNEKLFEFNFVTYKNIDLENIDLNEYSLYIFLKKIDLQIYKEQKKLENSFLLDELKITYEKKNLIFIYNNLTITSDPRSNLFSFLFNPDTNTDTSFNNKNSKREKEINIESKINYEKIFQNIINKFTLKGNVINIIINTEKLLLSLNLNDIDIFEKEDEKKIYILLINNWKCISCILNSNRKIKNEIKSDKKTILKYERSSKYIKAEMDSVYCNANIYTMTEIYDNFSSLFKVKNSDNNDIILEKNKEYFKLDFNINNFQYDLANKYIFSVSKIDICNYNDKNNILSKYYLKMHKIMMKNYEKSTILYSELLNIDYDLLSIEENKMNINCQEINFNISQEDYSFFSSFLKSNDTINYSRFYSDNLTNKHNFNKLINTDEIDLSLCGNDANIIKEQNSGLLNFGKGNQIKLIKLNISFQKIDLCFCKNKTYEKIINLSMNDLKIISNITLLNEISLDKEFNHNLSVQKLDLIYFDIDDEKFTILKKREKNFVDKQLEIKYGNNNCEIRINSIEINLRIDALLKLYYYFKRFKAFEYISINKAIDKKKFYTVSFYDSKFKLSTSFEGKENLFLDINYFTIIYNKANYEFPYGDYDFLLDKISSNIILKNNERKLFNTGKNCLTVKLNYYQELISSNTKIEDIMINLSYRDFVSFLRAYQLNLKLINSVMNNKENLYVEPNNKKEEIKSKIGETSGYETPGKSRITAGIMALKKINLTLIDDSKGSYQPFLNFTLENFSVTFDPDDLFYSEFWFRFSSYNYIACVWEPVIEKLPIKSNGSFNKDYKINIDINCLLLNLSDMAISFTLVTFNNWLTKLDLKTKKFENKQIIFNNMLTTKQDSQSLKNITKITNNQVINYTGVELKIIHNGNEIQCPPLEKIELDNSDLNDIEDIKKTKNITLIYDKDHKFELPIGKIISLQHHINEKVFIISENSLSEKKTINISLYSPIIFKNKTPYIIKIIFSNKKYNLTEIILVPNSICGLPLNLFIPDTYFWFFLIDSKYYNENNRTEDFSLDKILNSQNLYKTILNFSGKVFNLELIKKHQSLRILSIYSEYNIINCLPCDIRVYYSGKNFTIEKCTQHYITDNNFGRLFVELEINTEYGVFLSEKVDLVALKNNNITNYSLVFRNNKIGKKFNLPCIFKRIEEEKVFIIYSELILYNRSGLNITIDYVSSSKLICFSVKEGISLISSNIDYQGEVLQFRCGKYFSKNKKISKLIQITNNENIKMIDADNYNPFDIIIKKKSSYIKILNNPDFKENIISMVFTIFPMCRIINLLSTKKFIFCDYENRYKNNSFWSIKPFETAYFQFFHKGRNAFIGVTALDIGAKESKTLTKFQFKIGIYTLNADNFIFNLDIKKNPKAGCLDVYVLENNINNSQTILENLSDEAFTIYQINHEKKAQVLYKNDIAPLHIHDFYNKQFVFKNNMYSQQINLSEIKNCQKSIKISNKTIIVIHDNGIKMKITFYSIEKYNKNSSSLTKMNFFINIKEMYISVIGDNEFQHPKLTNYTRNEFMLIYINKFQLNLKIEKTSGLLNKYFIKTTLLFDKLKVYNQLSSEGKFALILENEESPCGYLENEINFYINQKIINVEKQKIIIKKLILGIDPDFWRNFLTFYDNVLYKMDLTYFSVNKIFISNYKSDPKNLIKKHMKRNILVNAIGLKYPILNVEYQIAKKGLKNLLKERFACSDFYIWAAKGLVGDAHDISIETPVMDYKNGTIVQYFVWLYYVYLEKIEDNISEIGFKGILGQFINFIDNLIDEEEPTDKNFQKKRKREVRPFYGKFKYYKEYNKSDAIIIKNIFSNSKNAILKKYYPLKIIEEKNHFYLFTTISMLYMNSVKYQILWNVDYFAIKSVTVVDNKVIVLYNQKIDNFESGSFQCEKKEIAREVAETLNEEVLKNKEYINEL